MAYFDSRNVAMTVHAIPRRRLPCEIGCAIDPYQNGGRTWTWCHRWQEGPWTRAPDGEQRAPLSRCVNCGKTVRETLFPPILPRQPKAPKTNRRIDAASMGALQAAIESGR